MGMPPSYEIIYIFVGYVLDDFMNKRTLIICICVVAVLAAVVAVAVVCLYSDGTGNNPFTETRTVSDPPKAVLLEAVPSDAAMLMTFSKFSAALSTLNDSTKVLGLLMTDAGAKKHPFYDFVRRLEKTDLGALKNREAVLSMHYAGSLEPLLIVSTGRAGADTSAAVRKVLSAADSSSLQYKFLDCSALAKADSRISKHSLLLLSSSATLLTASQRHIEGNVSILNKDGFSASAVSLATSDALYLCNDYAPKYFPVNLQKAYSSFSGDFSTFANWTCLGIGSSDEHRLSLSGILSSKAEGMTSFVNIYKKTLAGDSQYGSIVPVNAAYAVSVSVSDVKTYIDSYRQYLDTRGKMDKYDSRSKHRVDSLGLSPLQWAEKLDVKELVKAGLVEEDGLVPVLFLRLGKEVPELILRASGKSKIKELAGTFPNLYKGFVPRVFGSFFDVNDESCLYKNGWLALGPESALSSISDDKLKTNLTAAGLSLPSKNTNLSGYFSVGACPSLLDEIFKPAFAEAVKRCKIGASDLLALMSVSDKNLSLDFIRTEFVASSKDAISLASKDTVVIVPSGPFKVLNSGTGKTNLLSQSSNGSLTLKDEKGKSLWGISFGGKLCGRVESVDYYSNGKIQFLFASGNSLYLLDRLGRFVKGFPVSLGKEILLGPAAYDFLGSHAYRAMVLHTDNSVGLYNLHGQPVSDWKGINSQDTIKSLPELLECNGKKYWAVRTSVQTLIYDFMGGEPLTRLSGGKMIRPDSEIQVKDGNLVATCLDGKVRNVKL